MYNKIKAITKMKSDNEIFHKEITKGYAVKFFRVAISKLCLEPSTNKKNIDLYSKM